MQKSDVEANRPEEGQMGSGFGHRRGGTGGRFWCPPERSSGWCRHSTSSYPLTLGEWRHQLRRHSTSSYDQQRVETQRDKGPGAQNLVIKSFSKHDIALHIDDGCMGGGEALTGSNFDNDVTDTEFKNNYYGNTAVFNSNRHNIFRYCLIAPYHEGIYGESFPQTNPTTGRRYSHYGDRFIIADQEVRNEGLFDTETEWSMNFIHELGHGLGLAHPSDNDGNRQNDWDSITSMYTGIFDCVDYATSNSKGRAADKTNPYSDIDVTNEWDAIDLAWGLNF